jgi:hypothetical protein
VSQYGFRFYESLWRTAARPNAGIQLSFKQSVLMESRREKVAQSDYFRRPPPEKPEEEHPGLTVILV